MTEWNIFPPNRDRSSKKVDEVERIPSYMTKDCLRKMINCMFSPRVMKKLLTQEIDGALQNINFSNTHVIGCSSPTRPLEKIIFSRDSIFLGEYKPMQIQFDSINFPLNVTRARKFQSYSFHSAYSTSKDKSMPVKNQLPTLSELYSIYEEIPEELLNETDILISTTAF